jgi:hypothetical protein
MIAGKSSPWSGTLLVLFACTAAGSADDFQSAWPIAAQRTWAGPEYWANPLQDWRIAGGRLECVASGAGRNVSLLTHQLNDASGEFRMSVRLGRLGDVSEKLDPGIVGFAFGVRGPLDEWRNNALHGEGTLAGIDTGGHLVLGSAGSQKTLAGPDGDAWTGELELRLEARPDGDRYRVALSADQPGTGEKADEIVQSLEPEKLLGNLALVCSLGSKAVDAKGEGRGGNVRFWFADWKVSGGKVTGRDDHRFGPILFSQYTLSGGTLKITAQMPPIGQSDSQVVGLQIRTAEGDGWVTVGEAPIDRLSRTATVRVDDWNAARDAPYRLVYRWEDQDYYWAGTIRRDPVDRESILVAGFTGHQDYAFPNEVITENVAKHDPDLLFFSGDQLYEGNAGYGIQREPVDVASLDYLRKWYVFGWGFRELMRDRPSITIPDDHDVYQGNIWGGGGRKIEQKDHDAGGYVMAPEWVNMVQRTQTDHLPDPFDPTPVEQGITVYYTAMNYGRISFAVLEDRKWKSGPKGLCPPTGGRADHVTDPQFDPKTADVPGAKLLGDRQLKFLADWAADWRGADFKVALSQTIFCGSSSLHGGNKMRLVADYDCNGWPQSGRNRALYELRRGLALHVAGDQHLASIIQQGIDDFDDAVWSFCVPSIAAGYPRVWAPLVKGENRLPGMPDYTGEFFDGLGNRMTIWAVANPRDKYRSGVIERARDKASGYGIVRLNKKTRKITLECWPLDEDPTEAGAVQYPGWPKTIDQLDNDGRRPVGYLPTIQVSGMTNPVVQVIDEDSNRIVYTVRALGTSFRAKVYAKGQYTVKVGEPETGLITTLGDVPALKPDESRTIEVKF